MIFLTLGILIVAPSSALSKTSHRGQRGSVRVTARSALTDRFPLGKRKLCCQRSRGANSTGDAASVTSGTGAATSGSRNTKSRAGDAGRDRSHRSPALPLSLLIVGLAGTGLASLGLAVAFPRSRKLKPGRQPSLLPTPTTPVATSVGQDPGSGNSKDRSSRKRVGEYLLEHGVIGRADVAAALHEQRRTGGRFGEILQARGIVGGSELRAALAEQRSLPTLVPEYEPIPLLPRDLAYGFRAVALTGPDRRTSFSGTQLFAVTDLEVVPQLEQTLRRTVQARLADVRTMDLLLADAYAHIDGPAAGLVIRRGHLRRGLQCVGGICLLAAGVVAVLRFPLPAMEFAVALTTVYCLGLAWRERHHRLSSNERAAAGASTSRPESDLPECTVLVPLSRESRRSLADLQRALAIVDYPPHKLQGLALLDPSDRATRRWLRSHPLPPWVSVLLVPRDAGGRSGSLVYGLLQARGQVTMVAKRGGSLRVVSRNESPTASVGERTPAPGGVGQRQPRARHRLTEQFLRAASPRQWIGLTPPSRARHTPQFRTTELQAAFGWNVAEREELVG